MEQMRRSPERLDISAQFYLCWCFIALICGIVLTRMADYPPLVSRLWESFAAIAVVSAIISASLFWYASRWAHSGLLSLYLIVCSGWLMLGICVASIESLLHPPASALSHAQSGIYALTVQKIDKRKPDSARLEGEIQDEKTDLPFRTLSRVTVTVYHSGSEITEGDEVVIYGRLFPLSPPVFANSPDFSRQLRLRDIAATGIGYKLISHHSHPPRTFLSQLSHYRHGLAKQILVHMSAEQGAIASAMLVGVRDYVQNALYELFRAAGLAHLLAISGLHMGIFCIFIFSFLRYGLALIPHIAMRFPAHKYAAICALLASLFYLFLTGFPVSAIRAFLMSSLVIIAIISDRLALTYRNLALVGIIILLFYPSAVYTASFQLSFSATFALVTAVQISGGYIGRIPFVRSFLFLSFSSALITLFSLPFASWHFATISLWGVASNIVAIPLTGMVIMPAGVLMLVSLIAGLPAFGASIMDLSLSLLLVIVRFFAGLPGASIYLNPPEQLYLLGWTICILAILSLRQVWRYLAITVFLMLLAIWFFKPQTDAVIFHNGKKSVFVMAENNRLIASAPLSPFWRFQIYRHLGAEHIEVMRCESGVCSARLDDRYVGFVEKSYGLTHGCRQKFDLLVTPFTPRYLCRAPRHLLRLKQDAHYLISFERQGRRYPASIQPVARDSSK